MAAPPPRPGQGPQQQMQQHQQQPMMSPPPPGQPGARPPQPGGMPPPPGAQFQGRPMPPPGSGFARPPPGAPVGGLAPGHPAGGMQRPASTGPAPYPQGARPPTPGGVGARPMSPPQGMVNRNGSLTPGPPGQPQQGRMSPRPPMPAGPGAPGQPGMQPRPPMPGMPMQSPPMPQQQPQHQQTLHGQMAGMSLNQPGAPSPGAAQSPPPPPPSAGEMGPARTKRSARAYHTDAQPGGGGWNDAPVQPNPPQAPWQQAAAARVAAFEGQLQGNADSALDQMPGQRNTVSQAQIAHNRAMMSQGQGPGPGQQRAPMQPQGGPGGAFSQAMPPQQPGGGIAQPPHQAGQRFAGPRSKIDPDQIPSPVEMQDADQEFFDKEWFATCGRGGLPLSTTSFAAVDQGNCSPKHVRLTTYSMPATDELATTSQLPIALLLQPFAQLRADEAPIPTAHFGDSGPPRCKRCRAYINAWCVFVEGGQKWTCNLCGTATEVAADYFCNLDMSGRRVDFESRPELSRGTVDFAVPKEYWAVQATPPASVLLPVAPASTLTETAKLSPRPDAQKENFDGTTMGLTGQGGQAAKAATKAASDALSSINIGKGRTTVRAPRPMTYLFAIDVSFSAVRCGALQSTVDSIRETLYGAKPDDDGGEVNGNGEAGDAPAAEADEGPGFGLPHGSRVAILTFDRSLHFYNLSSELDQAQMLVVPDIEEPFVPISDGLLADPWESKHLIESLLNSLPTMFADNMTGEAALGAAVRGAQAALTTIGGQVNLFLSTIPTVGPGSLKHREDTKLYGTDKEKNLFVPQDGFYRGVAEECVEAGIGVNVFFFPSQYIDVATISVLTGLTGGEAFFHPRYDPVRDGAKLRTEVRRTVLRETGYNVTMRVRCSNGLRVADHYGNFYQRNVTDIELGTMDADKCIAALIKHEAKLDEKHEVYFQCAVLYTTAQGERRVRCHNLAVPVSSLLGNVFRYADMDSAVAFYMKETISLAHTKPLKDVRHYLTDKCVKVLLAYRRNCASSTSPGQLILPESFKLFPLYALAINKTKAIKGGNVTSDVRTFYMRLLRGAGVPAIMNMLYPRMVALHTMRPDDGEPIKITTPDGSVVQGARIKSPPLMRPSYLRMEAHGAYLLENGEVAILWLGADVNPKLVEDLYGVARIDDIDPRMTRLPRLPTKLSKQARALVKDFALQRNKPELPVLIARQNRDGTEVELANSLVEDQNNDAMSYVDYLCHVHRIISSDMTSGKDEGGSWFST
ncbi:related to Protein transport protein Sec24C [Pseudozyma flocculosa]|uniref:Related to Protein transport protein Sec24C n=2 Tax=Pseudozyma flocculosa TaxID=84751 RepID=A0A5C3F006_9BASI|nr:related to Protein transport protein Sec24C [Pseudozyma flocculosa]